MEMRICPECGREVSNNIDACNYCGYPLGREIVTSYSTGINPKSNYVGKGKSVVNIAPATSHSKQKKVIVCDGYLNIWNLVILSIVTLGVFSSIWVYRTVGLFNRKCIGKERIEGVQLLLYMFVPFYKIYWFYKQSKMTEEYTLKVGNRSNDLSVISLIFSLLRLSLVSMVLLQDQINKNIEAEYNGRTFDTEQRVNPCTTRDLNTVDRIPQEDIAYLSKLKELLDVGVLSEEEYQIKKNQILKG